MYRETKVEHLNAGFTSSIFLIYVLKISFDEIDFQKYPYDIYDKIKYTKQFFLGGEYEFVQLGKFWTFLWTFLNLCDILTYCTNFKSNFARWVLVKIREKVENPLKLFVTQGIFSPVAVTLVLNIIATYNTFLRCYRENIN